MPRQPRQYSAKGLGIVDGRTREARLMRTTRAELTVHVGGKPSATQRQMIERCVQLTIYVAQLDARATRDGGLSDHARREYLAYSNSLTRALRLLGFKGQAERMPTISEYLERAPGVPA